MKIGIDGTILEVEAHAVRGIGRYTRKLIESIFRIDNENEFEVLVGLGQNITFEHENPAVSMKEMGFRKLPPLLNKRFLRKQIYNPYLIRKSQYDVFHFPTHLEAPAFQPFKSVVSVLDAIPYLFPEYGISKLRGRQKLVERAAVLAARSADLVITISEVSRCDIVKHFELQPEKVRVVHLAADEVFKPLDEEQARRIIRERYNISGSFVLYVGGFDFRKNVMGLIEIFGDLKKRYRIEQKLVIVGSLPASEEFSKIMKTVIHHNLSGQVIFTDFVPDEYLIYFYNAADIFVFPSLYEGFGLPLLEAMVCGTPVVAFNNSSIPEIVGDAGILVDSGNCDELANAVMKLIESEDLYENMVRRGLEQAAKFSWEKTAQNTLKVYQELAGS